MNTTHPAGPQESEAEAQRRRVQQLQRSLDALHAKVDRLTSLVGTVASRQAAAPSVFLEHAYRVRSQWGEDGLIEHLVRCLGLDAEPHRCVEIGVGDYREANTRWLVEHRHWEALIIDRDADALRRIRADEACWRHTIVAVAAAVTAENVNDLLRGPGFGGRIGLLSIDVDGVDYWIWKAIECVEPEIVVIEYNAKLGAEASVTVPYRPDFDRFRAHHSGLYFGASLAALASLGRAKGYALVGVNDAGNNAFFVRKAALRAPLAEVSAAQAFRQSRFREARDADGRLTFPTHDQACAEIAGLPLTAV